MRLSNSIKGRMTGKGRQVPGKRVLILRRSALTTGLVILAFAGLGMVAAATPSGPSAMASSRIPAGHLQQYSDLALTWMQEYLRIDTTNPPGHEMRAVSFYKNIFLN